MGALCSQLKDLKAELGNEPSSASKNLPMAMPARTKPRRRGARTPRPTATRSFLQWPWQSRRDRLCNPASRKSHRTRQHYLRRQERHNPERLEGATKAPWGGGGEWQSWVWLWPLLLNPPEFAAGSRGYFVINVFWKAPDFGILWLYAWQEIVFCHPAHPGFIFQAGFKTNNLHYKEKPWRLLRVWKTILIERTTSEENRTTSDIKKLHPKSDLCDSFPPHHTYCIENKGIWTWVQETSSNWSPSSLNFWRTSCNISQA